MANSMSEQVRLTQDEWEALQEIYHMADSLQGICDPDSADFLNDDGMADVSSGCVFIKEKLLRVFRLRA